MKIISFSGKAGSGKDTAYHILSTHLSQQGYNCAKLSFANKLKTSICDMFYWDRDLIDNDVSYKEGNTLANGSIDPACELLGMTRREVLQKYGTDAVRNGLHLDSWIITLRLDIMHGLYDHIDYGFITDARFINELTFTKDLGGSTIQVYRSGDISTLTNNTNHLSETEWETWTNWDAIIENPVNPELSTKENIIRFEQNIMKEMEYIICQKK